MNRLTELIKHYYEVRKLKWPNFENALKFVHTELGEVYELDLSREGGWIRNNPKDKPEFDKESLGKELGDAIMMLIVAGIVEGIDPLESLEKKINSKLSLGVEIKQSAIEFMPEFSWNELDHTE